MIRCLVLVGVLVQSTVSQDLNIIPNILRPFFMNAEQLPPINLMANISEKLFHLHKIGLHFGKKNSIYCIPFLWSDIEHIVIILRRTYNASPRLWLYNCGRGNSGLCHCESTIGERKVEYPNAGSRSAGINAQFHTWICSHSYILHLRLGLRCRENSWVLLR